MNTKIATFVFIFLLSYDCVYSKNMKKKEKKQVLAIPLLLGETALGGALLQGLAGVGAATAALFAGTLLGNQVNHACPTSMKCAYGQGECRHICFSHEYVDTNHPSTDHCSYEGCDCCRPK